MNSRRREVATSPFSVRNNNEIPNAELMPSDDEDDQPASDRQLFYKVYINQNRKAIPKNYSWRDKAQAQLVLDGLDMLQASQIGVHIYAYYRLHHKVHKIKDDSQQFFRSRVLWPDTLPPPIDCTYSRDMGSQERTTASAKAMLRDGLNSALSKIVTNRLKKEGKHRAVSPSPKVGAIVDQFSELLDNLLEMYPKFHPGIRHAEFDTPELILFPRAAARIRNLLALDSESEPLSHSALPDKYGNEGGNAGLTLPGIVKALKAQRSLYNLGGDSIGKSVRVVGIGKTPLHVHEFMLDARMFLDEFAGPDGYAGAEAKGITLPVITVPQVIPDYFQTIPQLKKYFKFRFGMFKQNRDKIQKKEIPEWKRNLERLPFKIVLPQPEARAGPVPHLPCTLPIVMNSKEWVDRPIEVPPSSSKAGQESSPNQDATRARAAPWEIDPRMPAPPAFLVRQLGFGAGPEPRPGPEPEPEPEPEVEAELHETIIIKQEPQGRSNVGRRQPSSLPAKKDDEVISAPKQSYVYLEEATVSPAMYDLMCEFAGELFQQNPEAPRPMPQPSPAVAAAIGYTIVDHPPSVPVQCAPMPQPPGITSAKSLGYNFRMLKKITLQELENNRYSVSDIPGAKEALAHYKNSTSFDNMTVQPPAELPLAVDQSDEPSFVLSDSESESETAQ